MSATKTISSTPSFLLHGVYAIAMSNHMFGPINISLLCWSGLAQIAGGYLPKSLAHFCRTF